MFQKNKRNQNQGNSSMLINGQQSDIFCQSPVEEYCKLKTKFNKERLFEQIHSQYNLDFSSVYIIGQCNILSGKQFEENVIQQLIQNNNNVALEDIRTSDVVLCSQKLHSILKKAGIKAIIKNVMLILSLIIGCTIDCIKRQKSEGEVPITPIIPQAIQCLILIFCLVMNLIGILKCRPQIIKISLIAFTINFLYSCLVVVIYLISGDALFDDRNVRYGVQTLGIILSILSLFTMVQINLLTKRFCVLVKQIQVSQLNNKFYIF